MNTRRLVPVLVISMLAACGGDPSARPAEVDGRASPSEPITSPSPTATSTPGPYSGGSIEAAVSVAAAPMAPIVGFGSVWVSNHHADLVTRIDPTDGSIVAEIPVGMQPGQLLVTGEAVWVAEYGTSSVARIDPATNHAEEFDAGNGLTCGAPAEADGLIWVGQCDAGSITGVDPKDGHVERTLDVAGFPFSVAGQLWVSTEGDLRRLDTRTGDADLTIRAGCRQAAGASSLDGERLWITYRVGDFCQDGRVAIVDLRSGRVQTVGQTGLEPDAPIVEGHDVWIHNAYDHSITQVDAVAGEVLRTFEIPPIEGVGLAAGFGSLWIPDFAMGFLYRLRP